ncbi:MAG: AsmA-like C-terminal region-containing protein [Cytophagales bacterium]|nr:AsmA-like C-terminal region-containing protein [Cytophagales bacterium]
MKILKRILLGLGIFLVLLVAAAAVLPILFKDDIKAALDREIAKNVNADVVFDVNNFSLTAFKNFPNITAQIKELGVFNRAPFEGQYLFVVNQLDIEINLADVLFGDQLRLKGITMLKPRINVKVLKDGRANYDIAMPSSDTVAVSSEPTAFSFGIDHWAVVDGDLVYEDESIPYFLSLRGLNHTGSGNFNQDVFDLTTRTTADTVTTSMGTMQFLNRQRAEMEAVIAISDNYSTYTFKENTAKVNDFVVHFDGWFKMNPDTYTMDITFKSPANTFKSLLSLIPGMYTKDFKRIETAGELTFDGFVKGTYSEKQMPAFRTNFVVKDAMFKYPDLPTPVSNIALELLIDNQDGVMENTVVDLRKLHLDFGSNPLDARLRVENLRNYKMDGNIKAKLNLGELSKMFPMEGMEMRGLYTVDATAKGVYDSLRKIIPSIDASMSLTDGYVKSSKFPVPLQDLAMRATIKNTSGKMAETTITVNPFSMVLDGEKLTATMVLQNLDDYSWDIKADGGLDLEKMTKIFPLEGMTLAGKVKANVETRGKMSDVNAKRYDKLPTSGTASIKDFRYNTKDMPAFTLKEATASFDPKKIELNKMEGTIGKSDFNVSGKIENYIAYVLNNETIKGVVNFNSRLLDLNEFMSDSGTPAKADTASFGVLPIPENIDFVLRSSVGTVKMMDYTMTNASGDVILRNGIANLSGLKFGMLGGSFVVNGSYNAKDIKHPKYDLDLKIEQLSIQQAAQSFSVISTYAPFAKLINGNFSTDFKLSGELTNKMMPNMATVNGAGLLKIAQAALTGNKLLSGISSLTSLNNTESVSLKDVLMSASIDNGRFSVKPFEVKFGDYATTISGTTGLDLTIDYSLKMMIPAGQAGAQLQGFLNQQTGSTNPTDKIPVTIGLGGTMKDPKAKLIASEQKEQVKQAITNMATQKSQEAAQQLLQGAKPDDVLKNILSAPKADTTRKDSTATPKKDPVNQLQQLQNLLKKKKN